MKEEELDPEGRKIKFQQWNGKDRSLHYEPEAFYVSAEDLKTRKNGGVSVISGVKVEKIDADRQVAHLSNGNKIRYGKCLLATGGKPKTLDVLRGRPELEEKAGILSAVALTYFKSSCSSLQTSCSPDIFRAFSNNFKTHQGAKKSSFFRSTCQESFCSLI